VRADSDFQTTIETAGNLPCFVDVTFIKTGRQIQPPDRPSRLIRIYTDLEINVDVKPQRLSVPDHNLVPSREEH
jgi:hypothetical protein